MLDSVNRMIDRIDAWGTRTGLLRAANWSLVRDGRALNLYAGRLSRHEPQYRTHIGITPFAASKRNIPHDLTQPFPIADDSVELFQSSDVFEHIDYDRLSGIIAEIHRVLKPGGMFRLSVPDYRNDIYRRRTQRREDGSFLFDPGGGGRLEGDRVVDGGHLWFPTIESVKALFDASPFAGSGKVDYLHYIDADEQAVVRPIDYAKGYILRTPDHDARAMRDGRPLSIVVDAVKG